MKRLEALVLTTGLIFFILVSIIASGVHVVSADCYYDCYWETACIVNHQTGCEQHYGLVTWDGTQWVWRQQCSNPCSINCVK